LHSSIWFDEAISLVNARQSLPDLINATRSDVHPPLYYLLLHVWLTVRQSDGYARFLSAIIGATFAILARWPHPVDARGGPPHPVPDARFERPRG